MRLLDLIMTDPKLTIVLEFIEQGTGLNAQNKGSKYCIYCFWKQSIWENLFSKPSDKEIKSRNRDHNS